VSLGGTFGPYDSPRRGRRWTPGGSTTDRRSPLDSLLLHVEDGVTYMHIASCAIFERPPPPFQELVTSSPTSTPVHPARAAPRRSGAPAYSAERPQRVEQRGEWAGRTRPGAAAGDEPVDRGCHRAAPPLGLRPHEPRRAQGDPPCARWRDQRRDPVGDHQRLPRPAPRPRRSGLRRGGALPRASLGAGGATERTTIMWRR
jgi:hypothetical protein